MFSVCMFPSTMHFNILYPLRCLLLYVGSANKRQDSTNCFLMRQNEMQMLHTIKPSNPIVFYTASTACMVFICSTSFLCLHGAEEGLGFGDCFRVLLLRVWGLLLTVYPSGFVAVLTLATVG